MSWMTLPSPHISAETIQSSTSRPALEEPMLLASAMNAGDPTRRLETSSIWDPFLPGVDTVMFLRGPRRIVGPTASHTYCTPIRHSPQRRTLLTWPQKRQGTVVWFRAEALHQKQYPATTASDPATPAMRPPRTLCLLHSFPRTRFVRSTVPKSPKNVWKVASPPRKRRGAFKRFLAMRWSENFQHV